MKHLSHDQVLEIAWRNVTPELKARIRAAMPRNVALRVLQEKRRQDAYWHFSGGMNVRNYFRKTIPDADLPPFDEYYGPGTDVRNWDDYYDCALEYCAGERD